LADFFEIVFEVQTTRGASASAAVYNKGSNVYADGVHLFRKFVSLPLAGMVKRKTYSVAWVFLAVYSYG
jgi:hypothetical protein